MRRTAGAYFADAENPQPVVKVQLSDIIISAAEILLGAILVQLNMAGENPGDV